MQDNSFIKKLSAWGCDTEDAMKRMLDDEIFYRSCIMEFLSDAEFENLGKHIEAENLKDSFDSAHSIKGVSANLGLTPIKDVDCAIVEALRAESFEGVSEKYAQLIRLRAELVDIMSE